MVFDPFDLTMEVTPDNIMAAVRERQYSTALVMSFRLNEHLLKVRVMESIPIQDGEFHHEDLPAIHLHNIAAASNN